LTHTRTKDLAAHTKRADIVIAAIGQAHFLKAENIKPGATVLDVGISRTEAGIVGDVDPQSVHGIASALTPMPGGTGLMTVACLMENTVNAAIMQGVRVP
jgi:methylenetetrahydrofolate dehydrogenase (NADP+)/methenyltetrahydrofolate cyclohydrolase